MIGNKKIIALCISRIQDEESHAYITALNRAVTPYGYNIFVYNTCSVIDEDNLEKNAQVAVFDYINYDITDVVVVFEEIIKNEKLTDMLISRAKEHDVPVIVIGEAHEGCVNIKFDHENGFARIVRHMVCDHKMTRLHFMAGSKGNYFSDQRKEAFRTVLEENGLPFDESMVSYGEFWSDPAIAATEKLIREGNLPQAIICANDKMAIAVCSCLKIHGYRVPEDVAVTGFDGILEVRFATPRITTVVTDFADLATKTAEVMLGCNAAAEETKTYLVPLRICMAQSCGCAGETTLNASEYLNVVSDRYYRFQNENIMLSEIIAKVHRCENVVQVVEQLKHDIIYEMCCMLETECLDEKVNPMERDVAKTDFDRDMYVLVKGFSHMEEGLFRFPAKGVVPGLDMLLDENRVLVFSTMHYLDVPMGYCCFFFEELLAANYVKIPQTLDALNNAIGGYRNIRYRNYLMNRIDEMYRIDTLTGLRNRRGFEMEYQEMLEAKPAGQPLTVMMVDLDGLKQINDNYGHKEGDFAIAKAAQGMRETCPSGSLFTRFGGDEMLAVCPGMWDAEKLKEDFYEYFRVFNEKSSKEYNVCASMGVYHTTPEDDLSFESIVEKTDILMYMEKTKRKKNRLR